MEKYDKIIEETITECNRVFEAWVLNKKKTTYEDNICLIKSYITRLIKREYNYHSIRKISWYNPTCVVVDNRIKMIAMSSSNTYHTEYDRVLNGICERFKTFDFDAFDKNLRIKEMLASDKPKTITYLEEISFDDIKNIKF